MKDNSTRGNARILIDQAAVIASKNSSQIVTLIDISETGVRISGFRPRLKGPLVFRWFPVANIKLELKVSPLWRKKDLSGWHFAKLKAKERAFLKALVRCHRS